MGDVFITAAGEVSDDELVLGHGGGAFDDFGDGVGGFEGGDDAFELGEFEEGLDGVGVGGVGVFSAVLVTEPGVFGADGGVVESGGDGVGELDLAVIVLEEVGAGALEDAEGAALEAGGVLFGEDAFTAGFDADHGDGCILEEGVEEADGIGAAADAGDEEVGEAVFFFEDLGAGFVTDDALEVTDHNGVGVGAVGGTEDIVGMAYVGDPIAHGFVDSFLEGLLTGADGDDFGAEHFHAVDVEGLAGAVDGAHVDDALEAEHGGDRGCGDAVLSGAGFCDDAGFTHAFGEEDLSDGVIDFVGAGVEEVFAFEVDFGAAEGLGEAFGVVEGGGASAEFLEVVGEFLLEGGVEGRSVVFFFEFGEGVDEGFGDVASAVGAEVALGVRQVGGGGLVHGRER
ncbi:MAG: hypothetical protein RI897_3490 [Verrucomicrobiota bacterium]